MPTTTSLAITPVIRADAASQLRHFNSAAAEPWQQILKLRQLYLQLSFTGAGVTGKDIQDQLGAVDHPRVHYLLDVALLGGREIVIKQQKIRRHRSRCSCNFLELSLADKCGRVGLVLVLQKFPGDLSAGADGQGMQFFQRFFGAELRGTWSLRRRCEG